MFEAVLHFTEQLAIMGATSGTHMWNLVWSDSVSLSATTDPLVVKTN